MTLSRVLQHRQPAVLQHRQWRNIQRRSSARTLGLMPHQFAWSEQEVPDLLPGGARDANQADRETKEGQRKKSNPLPRSIQSRRGRNLKERREISKSRKSAQSQHR